MGWNKWLVVLLLWFSFIAGCSLSSDEKLAREQNLKQSMDTFISSIVQGQWDQVFHLTDGSIENVDKLKSQIMNSWVPDASLTGGVIASMAWVTDKTAKVKVNWAFQSESVQSFSSETYIFVWRDNVWKYKGRALR